MISLNNATIIGNVGSETEMRFTPNGKPVTSFSVACNHQYQKNGEMVKETDWFTVVVWNRLAELCNQFIGKGSLVYVSGRVYLHKWEGQDGKVNSRLEINASNVVFLSRKPEETPVGDVKPEDIPF